MILCAVAALRAAEPAKPDSPAELAERLQNLPANSWMAIEPLPSKRLVLQAREENAKVAEVESRAPAFREYTSPAFGDRKIFYFGGGHSQRCRDL
jgi:hypothetical protein